MRTALWFAIVVCVATGVFWQTVDAGTPADLEITALPEEGVAPQGAFPEASCRSDLGYASVGARLCMRGPLDANSFANAMAVCQLLSGRVADYGDWRYRQLFGDGVSAPVGWWLGPITGDNQALFVNSTNEADFDGVANRFDIRSYACAHDDNR
jgi:hypothetical protein